MLMVHDMFRREFTLMPGVVGRVAAGDHDRHGKHCRRWAGSPRDRYSCAPSPNGSTPELDNGAGHSAPHRKARNNFRELVRPSTYAADSDGRGVDGG
jgi:hypothetical protein